MMPLKGFFEPKMAIDKAARSEKIALIVKYIQLNRGQHSFYFLKYFGCEILNFVNVVGQMFFMDMFLGYEFSTYGLNVINYSEMEVDERPDPLAVVFPKVRSSWQMAKIFSLIDDDYFCFRSPNAVFTSMDPAAPPRDTTASACCH